MDTIYSLFQKVVKEHENAPAIIENDRAMTFGELSNMVDMITCSFPQEVHSIGTVSYTHLDVYKRQIVNCAFL